MTKVIRMESDDGIPVDINGTVIVGKTAFTVVDMKWEGCGGPGPMKTKARIVETGPWTANHIVWEADGLTLTGAVYKAMSETLDGVACGSQAHAERVAGRLSARLHKHIECAQAACKRAEGYLEAERARSKQKDEEIQRLRSVCIPDGMSYAETCLLRAKLDAAEKEIKHLQSAVGKKRGKSDRLGKKIAAQNEEIHRLNDLLRAIRLKYEGNNVKSFARMADPHDDMIDALRYAFDGADLNCRCWALSPSVSVVRVVDERPYAVLCGQCGQVLREGQPYCHACGASNRSCSDCIHSTRPKDGVVCGQVDCNGNEHWEARRD